MVFEWDDFGANHIISDMCQSHDCRDQLLRLKEIRGDFKATLFAIPAEMTFELASWCHENNNWVELAWHGFGHTSNYECEKMSYEMFGWWVEEYKKNIPMIDLLFKNIFRAPGWQISTEAMQWLTDHDWILADQSYNDDRRPKVNVWRNNNNVFDANGEEVPAYHGHTWNVGWNGIYEDFDKVDELVRQAVDFKFVSELF